MERKRQRLIKRYKLTGSSSMESVGHLSSKKSSMGSVDLPMSPKSTRTVRLQEYEEGESALTNKIGESHRTTQHPHPHPQLSEMEKRVTEQLEAEFTTQHKNAPHSSADKVEERTQMCSPLHSTTDFSRNSPSHHDKWNISSSPVDARIGHTPSDTRTGNLMRTGNNQKTGSSGHLQQVLSSAGGTGGSGFPGTVRHSDSNEWTEFACASVSGGSVEVGGGVGGGSMGQLPHYSSRPSSGEGSVASSAANMSEFDPMTN